MLSLIAAVARNGVIGDQGRMLWHLPADLQHFKRETLGCPVLMGRKTWDSLPERFRPLPGRRNVVVTRNAQWQAPGAQVAPSLDAALALLHDSAKVFVIGGAELYALALPLADELLLTEIDHDFAGDTRFPIWDRQAFVEVSRREQPADEANAFDLAFVTYRRKP